MKICITHRASTEPIPLGKIPFRTMKDELEAIENLGEEMPPAADESQYMFKDSSDVDMDAYCDPNVDLQKLGVSVDEHTYFGEVVERLGLNVNKSDTSSNIESNTES